MRKIVIIFIITSISYAIGLKALVIPYKASVISLSGAGIADNIRLISNSNRNTGISSTRR